MVDYAWNAQSAFFLIVDLERDRFMNDFTHFDKNGKAIMVDVSNKDKTKREASAVGSIRMSKECFDLVEKGNVKKGDVLGVARIAGIMASKRTFELIPLCHNIPIASSEINFTLDKENCEIHVEGIVKTNAETGVEMEALHMVSMACLTIYDMCKAVDKEMVIFNIHLNYKLGGKSGVFRFTK